MAATIRSKDERERDLARIADMYCNGLIMKDIAVTVGLSKAQIMYDMKDIRKRWLATQTDKYGERQERELSVVDQIEYEAWEGWQRSFKDREKLVSEKTTGENPDTKERIEIEGQAGDPQFLRVMLDCVEKRCKILGLFEAVKIENVTPAPTIEVLVTSTADVLTVQELLANGRFSNPSQN